MYNLIITGIEPQKRHKNRSSVFLDGSFSFGLSDFDLHRLHLKIGMELSEEELEEIRRDIVTEDAKQYALRLLDRQAYTEQALCRKLREREYDVQIISEVIQFLQEYHYIDDFDYAQRFITAALRSGKNGMYKIKYDLSQKGIARDIIDEAAQEFEAESQERELETLTALLEKKLNGDYSYQSLMKAKRYGFSRGFSAASIDVVLRRLKEQNDDYDF